MTPAIQIDALSKTFGKGRKQVRAVDNLSLEIAPGQVYGFLGPNGAGKTTTIRMLLDLIRPTHGDVRLFGEPVRQNHAILKRVGALVEGATFYPYLTGRANLEVLARTAGDFDPARISHVLAMVDMADRADRRVSGYSMGMKQRLGVAAALLGDPDLVILDEPTNGLDPAGIQHMRTFIRELVDVHGKTVFLSSHMLNEVEQICDRVAIVHNGQIVREGTVAELLGGETSVKVEAAPLDRAIALLRQHWTITPNGTRVTVAAGHDDVPHIVRALVAQDIAVYEVTSQRQSLEEYFLSVTSNE